MGRYYLIVVSKKQDVFLSETVTNDDGQQYHQSKIKNTNQMIDQKPTYVRSILQLIYYSFLSHIYVDNKYKDFYEEYYKTDKELQDEVNQQSNSPPEQNSNNHKKKKSNRQEEVDPFFQCFYQCSAVYNMYNMRKEKVNINNLTLRQYLQSITSNVLNVLRLMNGVIVWINEIKTNSLRLTLPSSNIDMSLYEF